ncbi:MAG: hypothetical protein ACW9W4_01225 [Candidatus Nitrosopumilus sp. bin_7KS]
MKYHKRSIVGVSILLVSLSIFFVFYPPTQYLPENIQSLMVYGTSAGGLILEILGFMVFMMIEKKAVFTVGDFAGGEPQVNGKPLGKDEHIVVRNILYEKNAIDLVVIGLLLQLFGIHFGLTQLF